MSCEERAFRSIMRQPQSLEEGSPMRRRLAILALSLLVLGLGAAQTAPEADQSRDALLLYRQGRDLETAGKQADAAARYTRSVAICDQELATDSRRIEAYVVKCWSLFRLGRHQEVVATGQAAMKVQFDPRISEVMGESYFYLGQNADALRAFQKYFEAASDTADRWSTAYFYVGETYFRMRKYAHADIAYSIAVAREPSMARWWYRLGLTCENLGEWKRSLEAYNKALALAPAMQEAVDGKGRVGPKASQ